MTMTSRERMLAAFEGRPVDMIPVAPYVWGAEYAWKLLGVPIWECLHGEGDMRMRVLTAINEQHNPDWVIPLHQSSQQLKGKTQTREDSARVYFTEDETGVEYVFDKEGHWFCRTSEVNNSRGNNCGTDVEPPTTKAEADEWLEKHYPHIFVERGPHTPDTTLRERFPDKFLCGGVMPPFAGFAYNMGFEPTLIMLHDNPSLCAYMIERTMVHVPHGCQCAAADGFDCAMMVDSWASADIMSPEDYKNWVGPLHKIMSDELHKVGLKSLMYNTGNIIPLMDSIVSLGFDAVSGEERIKGVEMGIGEMRELAGPGQCLYGNFDSYLLMRGDRKAIREEVRRQVSEGGPKAFVMGTGSPVCDDTDPEVMNFWIEETRAAYQG